jgi:hypothetical protein
VTILFGDMRTMNVPEGADILVSELLGSFGDNELSPECLDGAMRFLKRESAESRRVDLPHRLPFESSPWRLADTLFQRREYRYQHPTPLTWRLSRHPSCTPM